MYLTEYARRWQDFLDSIHSINSAGEEGSSGLAYDLQVLRTLASPDSPLMRLGKAVVEQTTLVPPPDPQARQKQLAQRASGNAGKWYRRQNCSRIFTRKNGWKNAGG